MFSRSCSSMTHIQWIPWRHRPGQCMVCSPPDLPATVSGQFSSLLCSPFFFFCTWALFICVGKRGDSPVRFGAAFFAKHQRTAATTAAFWLSAGNRPPCLSSGRLFCSHIIRMEVPLYDGRNSIRHDHTSRNFSSRYNAGF